MRNIEKSHNISCHPIVDLIEKVKRFFFCPNKRIEEDVNLPNYQSGYMLLDFNFLRENCYDGCLNIPVQINRRFGKRPFI